ncbi:nucleotidyltransferase family protein [Necropsobacter massiliensis]|uniref:nucleotidyltransferase family protein n=1 Tax=Necropsobacter massiliensis TaxID=1400001 RepID=UPI0005960345|nr:nucleotidyltransferase domain-containing protein [Necropsobacter massiliensis]
MLDISMLDIKPVHLQIVRDILPKNIPHYTVWAFGSRVKGKAKPYSDLDLAVIAPTPLSLSEHANLSEDFSESDLPWRVDIVDWATTSENFRRIIQQQYIVLQAPAVR